MRSQKRWKRHHILDKQLFLEKYHATSGGAVLARNKVDTTGMPGAVREGVKRGRPQPQAGAKQCAL